MHGNRSPPGTGANLKESPLSRFFPVFFTIERGIWIHLRMDAPVTRIPANPSPAPTSNKIEMPDTLQSGIHGSTPDPMDV